MPGVIAYHVILTCYGFWLPNDPRGSWSTHVRSFDLYRAGGPATKVDTHRSVARYAHDHRERLRAKEQLVRKPLIFTGEQGRAVMRGIGDCAQKNDRTIYAAAVMPGHVHLVAGRAEITAEKMTDQFKARATRYLNKTGRHPFGDITDLGGRTPSPWARKGWVVYLNDQPAVPRTIRYVENNPVKAGFKPQKYAWVTPFSG